jgi:thiol-disulfide isomerase/thioredoxin
MIDLPVDKPTIVLFTSATCAPCKVIKPLFSELEYKYPNINFVTYDISASEDVREWVTSFGVRAVPSVKVFGVTGEPLFQLPNIKVLTDFIENGFKTENT